MKIIKTNIDGVLIIEPRIFNDERGYFFESFSKRELTEVQLNSKVSCLIGFSYDGIDALDESVILEDEKGLQEGTVE